MMIFARIAAPAIVEQREDMEVSQKHEREPLSEREALNVGDSAARLIKLRRMLAMNDKFEIWSNGPVNWAGGRASYKVTQLEAQAIFSLLIEREELFLSSFGVVIEGKS